MTLLKNCFQSATSFSILFALTLLLTACPGSDSEDPINPDNPDPTINEGLAPIRIKDRGVFLKLTDRGYVKFLARFTSEYDFIVDSKTSSPVHYGSSAPKYKYTKKSANTAEIIMEYIEEFPLYGYNTYMPNLRRYTLELTFESTKSGTYSGTLYDKLINEYTYLVSGSFLLTNDSNGVPDSGQEDDSGQELHDVELVCTEGFVSSKPSSISVTLKASGSSTSWTTQTSGAWLTVSKASGSGSAVLNLSAADNPSSNYRLGELAVKTSSGTRSIVVLQPGRSLELSRSKLSFSCESGSSESIMVATDGKYRITQTEDWIHVKQTDNAFTVSVDVNLNMPARQGFIVVSLTDLMAGDELFKKLEVNQAGLISSSGNGDVGRDSHGADDDNNRPGSDTDINKNNYGTDENSNQPNGTDSDVTKKGYDDEDNLNQPGNNDSDVERDDFGEDENLNP